MTRRLAFWDRLILVTLVPLWAVAVIVHIDRHVSDRPLAWLPVYLDAAASPEEGPRVRSLWSEARDHPERIAPGDELLRVGERALLGAGRLDVLAHAFPAADANGLVHFEVKRDGLRVPAVLEIQRVPVPLAQLPLSLALGLSAVLALLQGRGSPTVRAFALAALATSLHFSSWYAGTPWQTSAGLWLVVLSGFFYPALQVRTALLFPEGLAQANRPLLRWAWLLLAMGPALYVWIFGAPSIDAYGFSAVGALSGLTIFAILLAVLRNWRRADAPGRRQMKWAVYSFAVGTLPVLAASALVAARPDLRQWYAASLAFQALVPLGMLVALIRDNLFDINRLITTTAATTLLAPLFLVALVQGVPPLAEWASQATGMQSMTLLWVITGALAAPMPIAVRRLRPWIERRFFREQFEAEAVLRDLRGRAESFESPGDLLRALGEELGERLTLETCVVYARAGEAFVPVSAHGGVPPPGFAAEGPFATLLADADGPVERSRTRRWERRGLLDAGDLASLDSLGANVILPIHTADQLEAFICFGDKLSGELYSRPEIAMLDGLGERVGLAFSKFEERALEAEQRRLFEEIARYAPASIADEIRKGADTAPGERDVTILFVDVRGYTAMSQRRAASEIFAVVNAYTEAVSRKIRDHGGTVIQFQGDGLMAAFGAPVELEDKERCAVEASLDVIEAVETGAFGERGDVTLSVGVGIATGVSYVGDIQSVDRKIWTVIGNTPNIAARLEAKTRDLDASIILDEVTRERAGAAAAPFEPREGIALKGRDEPFTLWIRPLGQPPPGSAGPRAAEEPPPPSN